MKTKQKQRQAMVPAMSGRAQMIVARAAPLARRAGGAAKLAAMSEKHTIAALATSAGLAYLDRDGRLDAMRIIDSVSPVATVGIGLWIAGKFTGNPMLQHAATGALSVAVFTAVKEA